MDDVKAIAKLMLNKVKINLEEKGITLKVTPAALDELALAGYDPEFGARPLRPAPGRWRGWPRRG